MTVSCSCLSESFPVKVKKKTLCHLTHLFETVLLLLLLPESCFFWREKVSAGRLLFFCFYPASSFLLETIKSQTKGNNKNVFFCSWFSLLFTVYEARSTASPKPVLPAGTPSLSLSLSSELRLSPSHLKPPNPCLFIFVCHHSLSASESDF